MNFLILYSQHLFLPRITQPPRIRDSSKTLIYNIFSNILTENTISGKLTPTISDHSTQFIILLHIFSNQPSNKSNIYEKDWSNFVQ